MAGEFRNDSLFVIFARQGREPIIQLTWANQFRASLVNFCFIFLFNSYSHGSLRLMA